MSTVDSIPPTGSLLAAIFSDDTFLPAEPNSIEETGLSATLIEGLICKSVLVVGSATGRQIAEQICLPFRTLEGLFRSLRQRQILVHSASAQMNDYYYTLTDQGRQWSQRLMEACAYVGPAPVPLVDYVVSVDAQTIRAEAPKRQHLTKAFADISVESELFDLLGPAINSGAGLFLYGAPGNGKTTLAARITMCFGQHIWVPRTLVEDGQLIKLYDAAYHRAEEENEKSLLKSTDHDRRWIKIRRPTVIVGGELTLDALEIRHDPISNVSEAPLQLKSNCGCLLVDDFGRQRIEPMQLLNRWIIPLENRHDFLTIATGKKIQVPFEQLIIFSTNLDPTDLTDEAFLRRIPYKIEVHDPAVEEFHRLFETLARSFRCEYRREVVDGLLKRHYEPYRRPLRRCHPRDLLLQIRNYCAYNELPMEMTDAHFDRVVRSYFTALTGEDMSGHVPQRGAAEAGRAMVTEAMDQS
jgi:predicted ATPase with chaperone activity